MFEAIADYGRTHLGWATGGTPDLIEAQEAARESGDWVEADEDWDHYIARKDDDAQILRDEIQHEQDDA